jgi:hypothetical protein
MRHRTSSERRRRLLSNSAFLLVLCIAISAHAQAPSSVFGQPSPQLQQHLEAQPTPLVPQKPPASATPNWKPATIPPSPIHASPSGSTVKPMTKARVPARQRSKQITKFSPHRTALLRHQIKIRDEQNRIARSLRGQWAKQPVFTAAAAPSTYASNAATARMSLAPRPASPLSIRSMKKGDPTLALARQPNGIWFVNDKQRDFVVTPGGNVVIFGKGFGQVRGEVSVKGLVGFPGGVAGLQVSSWTNFEVDATMPAGIRGVADLEGIVLEVILPGGKPLSLGNGRFVAAREEIVLPEGLDMNRIFDFRPSPNLLSNEDLAGGNFRQVALDYRGSVDRITSSSAVDCFKPGVDTLFPRDLPLGFQVSGIVMEHGRTDTGDGDQWGQSGNHMFFPGYGPEWGTTNVAIGRNRDKTVDTLSISWGVFRSHTSPHIAPMRDAEDVCSSNYWITQVWVVGPAGLSPFPR